MASDHKNSAELEREIDARRLRIENKVDELATRLSPGQIVDEALRFTRSGPGAEFANNMGRSVVNNPIPVALVGASLAWLFARPQGVNIPSRSHRDHEEAGRYPVAAGTDEMGQEFPVVAVKGTTIKRVSVDTHDDDKGERHSHFTDEAGRKFKALTDKTGNRAGHFRDETGRHFRGFIDETGHRVTDFRDETGTRMREAHGWASHNWQRASDGVSRFGRHVGGQAQRAGANVRHGARQAGDSISEGAQYAGDNIRHGSRQAVGAVDEFIHNQPLVSGAIAFAVGAILAGSLPHTRQEDEAFGEASDTARNRAMDEAGHLYERGRGEAEKLHDKARDTVSNLHQEAGRVASETHDLARSRAEGMGNS